MDRGEKIISGLLLALVLFLNLGLALGFRGSLHAHFLTDNRIIIHFHPFGNEHNNGHLSDSHLHYLYSTTLTYLNNSQTVNIYNVFHLYSPYFRNSIIK